MAVERSFPHQEAHDLLALVRDLVRDKLAPQAAGFEERSEFPRDVVQLLGRTGIMALTYPEEYGGGGAPYEVYLQILEEIASAWAGAALAVSVHTLSCYPVATFGTEQQRAAYLPGMLAGELIGAYSLSEATSGSDAGSLQARALRDGNDYVLSGTKAWVTNGRVADYYNVFCRTSDEGSRGVSVLLVPADAPGVVPQQPERKMGLRSSPTAQVMFEDVRVAADRLIGGEGQGMRIALSALDGGRLGIAATATGVAQAALDAAVSWARERRQFGKRIADFQGVSFLLADMATGVEASRATYLAAARRRDAGKPFGPQAAIAKLFATDTAMRVTTDAVQVLGGYGYTTEYPVERYMREAKVMQIFEGTNQIQRLVIGRSLLG